MATKASAASLVKLAAAYVMRKAAKAALNPANTLDSKIVRVAHPREDLVTGSVLGSLAMRYGPSAKNPRAKDAARGGTVGILGWSFAPGRSSAAYTAGTTPKELNKASKMGLTAPEKGAETRVVTSPASKSVVPFGATNAATEPRPSQSARRPRRVGSCHGEYVASDPAGSADARVAVAFHRR